MDMVKEPLARQNCEPTRGIVPPLTDERIEELRKQINYWDISEGEEKHLRREFKFANYHEALEFVNQVAEIAAKQDHHPSLTLNYKSVVVELWTHQVGGLHLNDFIMAAKAEEIYNRWDTVSGKKDPVQIGSELSFPASDPPAHQQIVK